MVEQGTNKTSCNTNEPKARITAAFTNLNKENVWKTRRRLGSRQETAVEANVDFIKSIQSIVLQDVIFKNISDKMRYLRCLLSNLSNNISIVTFIFMYIYIYRERERQIERQMQRDL